MKKQLILLSVILFSLNQLFAEKIIFSANSMTGKAGDSSTSTSLSGNAYIKTSSMEILADSVELSGDDYQNIKASGNVSGKNLETKMEFTCESLEYDRNSKIALLQGNVTLKDLENEVEASAQIIEYNQDAEIAILQAGITLKQKDNICTSSYAVYYKDEQLLELSGNAQVKQDDDTFRAQFITFNMETQDINLGGNVRGSVTDSKEIPAPEEEAPEEENPEEAPQNETAPEEKR